MKSLLLALPCALALAAHGAAQSDVGTVPAAATKTLPEAAIVQQVRVAPGTLYGRILTSGTRTPVAGHSFALLDNAGSNLGELKTNTDGSFATPNLNPGNYTLQVRNDLRLHLQVAPNATVTSLDIVLPQGPAKAPKGVGQDPKTLPAAPGGAAPLPPPPPPPPGLGVATWAIIGTGTAAAVAVPVVASQGESRRENPVSNSSLGIRR